MAAATRHYEGEDRYWTTGEVDGYGWVLFAVLVTLVVGGGSLTWQPAEAGYTHQCADECGVPNCNCVPNRCASGTEEGDPCSSSGATQPGAPPARIEVEELTEYLLISFGEAIWMATCATFYLDSIKPSASWPRLQ